MVILSRALDSGEKKEKPDNLFAIKLDVILNVIESEKRIKKNYENLKILWEKILTCLAEHPGVLKKKEKHSDTSDEENKIIIGILQLWLQIQNIRDDLEFEDNYLNELVKQIGKDTIVRFNQECNVDTIEDYRILFRIDEKLGLFALKRFPQSRNVPEDWKPVAGSRFSEVYYKISRLMELKKSFKLYRWNAEVRGPIYTKKCETCKRIFFTGRESKKRCSGLCKSRFFNDKRSKKRRFKGSVNGAGNNFGCSLPA